MRKTQVTKTFTFKTAEGNVTVTAKNKAEALFKMEALFKAVDITLLKSKIR